MNQTNVEKLLVGRKVMETDTPAIGWPAVLFVGRVLLALIFLVSGVGKFTAWSETAAFMQGQGLPWVSFLLALSGLVEIVGALSLITGTFARAGALLLLFYLVPVTLVMHDFWAHQGMERQMQLASFLKNLGLMGGLLLVTGAGAGRPSVDEKIQDRLTGEPTRPAGVHPGGPL